MSSTVNFGPRPGTKLSWVQVWGELDSDLGLGPICSWVQVWVQVGFGSRPGTNLQLGPGLGPGWIRIQVWDQTYVWVQTWDQVGF